MIFPEKDFLSLFGWDDFYLKNQEQIPERYCLGRVIGEEKNLFRLQVGLENVKWAVLSGKARFDSIDRVDYPAVGDWVLCTFELQDERALIHQVLARKSLLRRRQVDSGGDTQIIATNIDYLFVATSLNDDFNLNRLDRYLTLGWDSGAQPVILLTKSDLRSDSEDIVQDLELRNPGVPICVISSFQKDSLQSLEKYLRRGKTCVVVGSSGVGKSTLINTLLGEEKLKTQSIREEDDRGRHTTTSRHLFKTVYGGLIIDTPGMREIQMLDHEEGLQRQFSDIEELVMSCRFSNCQHLTEPGCKVLQNLESGALSPERWQSYLKLMKEVHHMRRKNNKALQKADRELWKKRIARRVVSNRSGE